MLEILQTLTAILLDPLFGAAFEFFSVLLTFVSIWDIVYAII